MTIKECATFWVQTFMSGPIDVAKQVLRQECLREGLCVTIEPTCFIYTGGEERGFIVTLRNYPRFPVGESALINRGRSIAEQLLTATFQHSAMLVAAGQTTWLTTRQEGL